MPQVVNNLWSPTWPTEEGFYWACHPKATEAIPLLVYLEASIERIFYRITDAKDYNRNWFSHWAASPNNDGLWLFNKVNKPPPVMIEEDAQKPLPYDKTFGDDKICQCGDPYYRHFDAYDYMYPIGCKYCACYIFVENKEAYTVQTLETKQLEVAK